MAQAKASSYERGSVASDPPQLAIPSSEGHAVGKLQDPSPCQGRWQILGAMSDLANLQLVTTAAKAAPTRDPWLNCKPMPIERLSSTAQLYRSAVPVEENEGIVRQLWLAHVYRGRVGADLKSR